MASQTFNMVNPHTGATGTAYKGYSWTTLLFGPFPALLRSDFIGALIGFGLAFVTAGLSWLVWPFFYNGWHQQQLTKKGYVVVAPAVGAGQAAPASLVAPADPGAPPAPVGEKAEAVA